MTVKELKKLIEDYPDDQDVQMRLWLKENTDYLDDDFIQCLVEKVQQSITGAVLITGTDY